MSHNPKVTVRFKLYDAVQRRQHPSPWEFYDGTVMAYFARQPFMWWPEGSQSGLPFEEVKDRRVDVAHAGPGDPVLVTLRLPRVALAGETRVPYVELHDRDDRPLTDKIRHLIWREKLRVGDALPTGAVLMDMFGASRSSIQAALNALGSSGYISGPTPGASPRTVLI